jgi:hypothetical protein
MTISKSEYMMFLRHPAWLWLKKFNPSILPKPNAGVQVRFDEGNLFEEYAYKLFPEAVILGFKNNGQFDGYKYNSLPEATKKEIKNGTKVIFQGRLETDNITSIFDVLERVGDNVFDLYEIKSSTSVKPEHIPDLAFQTIVLEKSSLVVRNIYVLHVNSEYIRKGEIDPQQLSIKTDVTEEVRACMDEVIDNIPRAFDILSKKEMPDISPRHLNQGEMAEWLEIFRLIKKDLPKYSIYDLCGLNAKTVGLLEDAGIEMIKDIPDDFDLSRRQMEQVSAVKNGRYINREEIKSFIDNLEYPIHFFDYETFSGAIPAFDGIKPYQQVPFQYSLHILEKPGGKLIHKEFLHLENSNPVLTLTKQMSEDFMGSGSVIAWHDSFERGRNEELSKMLPEYEPFLHNLNDRMVDLKIPFSSGWFIDKDFMGSASVKKVSPVIVDGFGYKDLEIAEGGTAQRTWMETVMDGKNQDSLEKIIENLKKYCGFDTEVMVKILEVLQKEAVDN